MTIHLFGDEARKIKEGQLFKAVIITDRERDCVELVPVSDMSELYKLCVEYRLNKHD